MHTSCDGELTPGPASFDLGKALPPTGLKLGFPVAIPPSLLPSFQGTGLLLPNPKMALQRWGGNTASSVALIFSELGGGGSVTRDLQVYRYELRDKGA